VALLLAWAIAGCGGPSGQVPPSAAGSATDGPPAAEASGGASAATGRPDNLGAEDAALVYGRGPTPDPRVTYQPDVVLIGGGPAAIRGATEDGLTWELDPAAPGVADLRPGSVMFATSVAVGRVVQLEDRDGSRVVTIAPIALTELFRDADLEVDEDLDLGGGQVVYRQPPADYPATLPDEPQSSPGPAGDASPSPAARLITLPPIRLVAWRAGDAAAVAAGRATMPASSLGGKLTLPGKICPELGVGRLSVELCQQGDGLQLTADVKAAEHLKFGFVLKLLATRLHLQAGTVVKDGQMVDSGGLLEGLDGLELKLAGGVSDGAQDNTKFKIEVPVEIESASIVVEGVPLKVLIEAKLTIETAFSGRNSTLSASGRWTLSGPIGIVGGKPVTPKLEVARSILDSISGVTIGPSGLVVGAKYKFQAGLGVYGFTAGPYVTLTVSGSVGQGSVLGASLAECRGATLGLWVGAGAGVGLNASKLGWLFGKNSLFTKYVTLKQEVDLLQYELFNRSVVKPDVPLCRP
jgi:hypothetical protein